MSQKEGKAVRIKSSLCGCQSQKRLTFLFCIGTADELVEDVEDSLLFGLSDDSCLLE